jgi:hypothetical protein
MASLSAFFTGKFFKVLLTLYFGLCFLIWIISSPVAKYFISPILAEQQLQLAEQASIRFNPFLMRLTLKNIDILSHKEHPQEAVFSLKKLTIEVALWRLAFDKIVLDEFSIEGGSLKVQQNNEELVIAGFHMPNNNNTASEKASSSTEIKAAKIAYQLVLPRLLVNKFDIEISKQDNQQIKKTHHIDIEQLSLNNVKASQTHQKGDLAMIALVDGIELALKADAELALGQGEVNSKLTINDYPIENLARYIKELTTLTGSLSFSSEQKLAFNEQDISLNIDTAALRLENLLLGLPQGNLHVKAFKNNIKNLEVTFQKNTISHLAGNSSIKLTAAALNQPDNKATIAAFKELNLADINFALAQGPSINIDDIILDEFIFSKKATLTGESAKKTIASMKKLSKEDGFEVAVKEIVEQPPVVKLKQLTLKNLHIHEKGIKINNIIFDTLNAAVIIKKNKDIANLISLNNNNEKNEAHTVNNTDKIKNEHNDAFTFSLDGLNFINENTLNFIDLSVEPIYQRTFIIDTFKLGALSNTVNDKQKKTPFTLAGRSNKYANFNLNGYLQPFANLASYHVEGDVKEFSLPAISSYIKESTGLVIKTGQLNTKLNVTLAGDELDGNIIILLQALETGFVNSEEAGNLIDQGILPLNMALGMLKDSDGNVELDVPLSGSTSDPQFGLSSIVTLITQKAIMSATQDYLMTTFVPYANIVSIAITAGEFALKLRFDDLAYQEKQIKPNKDQSAYLKDFIALMREKEETRVIICAISTPADIDLENGAEITNKESIKRLIKIGEEREHGLKDYLIEEGDIESSRILFCKPQIDSTKGATPRITISV